MEYRAALAPRGPNYDHSCPFEVPAYSPTIPPSSNGWHPYSGMVYDDAIPNHILLVRRNGNAVWSGNGGNESSLDITDQITVEAWVKPNTSAPENDERHSLALLKHGGIPARWR